MASDIAGSVVPNYDLVLTAPDDGDAVNSASITTLALGIANRVEFLRADLGLAQPWARYNIFEDFVTVDDQDPGGLIRTQDMIWRTAISGSGAGLVAQQASDTSTIGEVDITSGSAPSEFDLRTDRSFEVGQARSITIRLKQSGAPVVGKSYELYLDGNTTSGLNPGNPGVSLVSVNSTDWSLRLDDGLNPVSTTLIPGSTMSSNVYLQLDLTHDGVNTWTASADGGTTVSAVADASFSTATVRFGFRMDNLSASGGVVTLDFISAQFIPTGRVI